ncbi:hypothetical protein P5G50_06505 [Leifsonia sp. F6_8S_P_1B]|uniref:Uncharacterized protein n=1 Tax=Leifsonia williamsii TaxID=3035919 RepID=A0ABT8KBA9_9MICO|nr:hypothetical protein [Leifsonia williamsii]MDN4614101.1 hypothetical protein [Leifsonia williamsii]
MAASFSFRTCEFCGEFQPVLADGRMSVHFTADAERCRGSDHREGDGPVSEVVARSIELELRRVLNQLARKRAS